LAQDGRTLRRPEKGLQVSDEPYVQSKEIIVGFYLVEASDYEHAVELGRPNTMSRDSLELYLPKTLSGR
jgi:hypothetical protein